MVPVDIIHIVSLRTYICVCSVMYTLRARAPADRMNFNPSGTALFRIHGSPQNIASTTAEIYILYAWTLIYISPRPYYVLHSGQRRTNFAVKYNDDVQYTNNESSYIFIYYTLYIIRAKLYTHKASV